MVAFSLASLLVLGVSADDGPPLVRDRLEVLADIPAPVDTSKPRWVRHRVRPRERLPQIAARYGVPPEKLASWNKLDAKDQEGLRRRRTLRVWTSRSVPGRIMVLYRPSPEESWGDIAAKFVVDRHDLRAWNWQQARPDEHAALMLWLDPTVPPVWTSKTPDTLEPLEFSVSGEARSVGRPHSGRLHQGLRLPASSYYDQGASGGMYGSSHTVETVIAATSEFRRNNAFKGSVVIGAMSRRRGGRFPPHRSHQSGRDIDIRLPLLDHLAPIDGPSADEIDWFATWRLLEAFVATGAVEVVFLDIHHQRRVHDAARAMGVPREQVRALLSWPSWGDGTPTVRHARGHEHHMHIRIRCDSAEREPKCR